ncbi:MAG: hypothetical protein FRX49_08983 [Trebouxia sp. A1-2]|nr:MAG: hypothetical protein FRX49_08983 [Trebouxia sp. A1-2]
MVGLIKVVATSIVAQSIKHPQTGTKHDAKDSTGVRRISLSVIYLTQLLQSQPQSVFSEGSTLFGSGDK